MRTRAALRSLFFALTLPATPPATRLMPQKCDVFSFGVLAYELLGRDLLILSHYNSETRTRTYTHNPTRAICTGVHGCVLKAASGPSRHAVADLGWMESGPPLAPAPIAKRLSIKRLEDYAMQASLKD